jgi:hypothetical protein
MEPGAMFPDQPAESQDGDVFEATHSFIIKIWLERIASEGGPAVWRGHITHVPGGERRYIKEMDDILVFIIPYLESMGVRFGSRRRVRRWLNWLKPW